MVSVFFVAFCNQLSRYTKVFAGFLIFLNLDKHFCVINFRFYDLLINIIIFALEASLDRLNAFDFLSSVIVLHVLGN